MIKIKLIKDYGENRVGDTIQIANNVAFGLVESGIAKYVPVKEFIKKTVIGETKAFESAPSQANMSAKRINK